MNDLFEQPEDATPLTEEEKEGLIPSYISSRSELNEAEQKNIIKAEIWASGRKINPLDVEFLKNLHKRMFGNVWQWAGEFRKTSRNIGIEAYRIQTELAQLVDDTQYQIDNESYPIDEIATRFHHRLVLIHPFPNGNGRHSRLATDILLQFLGEERFTWGAHDLTSSGEIRSEYIKALRAADKHDIQLLLEFVRK